MKEWIVKLYLPETITKERLTEELREDIRAGFDLDDEGDNPGFALEVNEAPASEAEAAA